MCIVYSYIIYVVYISPHMCRGRPGRPGDSSRVDLSSWRTTNRSGRPGRSPGVQTRPAVLKTLAHRTNESHVLVVYRTPIVLYLCYLLICLSPPHTFWFCMCCLHLSCGSAFHASTIFLHFFNYSEDISKRCTCYILIFSINLLRTSFSHLDYVPRFPSSSPSLVTVAMGQSELVDWHEVEGQKKVGL